VNHPRSEASKERKKIWKRKVAELPLERRRIARIDRSERLVALFEEERRDRRGRLFPIPRALSSKLFDEQGEAFQSLGRDIGADHIHRAAPRPAVEGPAAGNPAKISSTPRL
jgi:hypothetical protein